MSNKNFEVDRFCFWENKSICKELNENFVEIAC